MIRFECADSEKEIFDTSSKNILLIHPHDVIRRQFIESTIRSWKDGMIIFDVDGHYFKDMAEFLSSRHHVCRQIVISRKNDIYMNKLDIFSVINWKTDKESSDVKQFSTMLLKKYVSYIRCAVSITAETISNLLLIYKHYIKSDESVLELLLKYQKMGNKLFESANLKELVTDEKEYNCLINTLNIMEKDVISEAVEKLLVEYAPFSNYTILGDISIKSIQDIFKFFNHGECVFIEVAREDIQNVKNIFKVLFNIIHKTCNDRKGLILIDNCQFFHSNSVMKLARDFQFKQLKIYCATNSMFNLSITYKTKLFLELFELQAVFDNLVPFWDVEQDITVNTQKENYIITDDYILNNGILHGKDSSNSMRIKCSVFVI